MKNNFSAKIKVIGVGGAGNNAVNHMVKEGLQGVEFYVVNTDIQALDDSPVENKIVIGEKNTRGLGAGANPEVGRKAAMESEPELREYVKDADMVFVAAGMGGGTGTGAAPVVARIAREEGALVVGVVTRPFLFEGPKRKSQALEGLDELRDSVDSIIIVSNDCLLSTLGNVAIVDAFKESDSVLRQGVQTITDLISIPAMINLDFADVSSIMKSQGDALIGIGTSGLGEGKASAAAQQAISSPLLEASITGAKQAIVNVTGGNSMSIQDASEAVEYIRTAAGNDINIIFGVAVNEKLNEDMVVTIVATGFPEKSDSEFAEVVAEEAKKDNFFPSRGSKKVKEVIEAPYETPNYFKKVEEPLQFNELKEDLEFKDGLNILSTTNQSKVITIDDVRRDDEFRYQKEQEFKRESEVSQPSFFSTLVKRVLHE